MSFCNETYFTSELFNKVFRYLVSVGLYWVCQFVRAAMLVRARRVWLSRCSSTPDPDVEEEDDDDTPPFPFPPQDSYEESDPFPEQAEVVRVR